MEIPGCEVCRWTAGSRQQLAAIWIANKVVITTVIETMNGEELEMARVVADYGYNHLEPGHPDNPKPYRICGALTRNEEALGPVCRKQAGWGTDHLGAGRCKLHGGANRNMGPLNPTFKHGRYAKIWKGRIRQQLEQWADDQTNPLDLMPELEVSRVVLAVALERMMASARTRSVANNKQQTGNVEDVNLNTMPMAPTGGVQDYDSLMGPADVSPEQFSQDPHQESSSVSEELDMLLIPASDIELVRQATVDVISAATKITASRNQTALAKADVLYIMAIMKDAIQRFVPRENQEAFIRYLKEKVPVEKEEPIGEIPEVVV